LSRGIAQYAAQYLWFLAMTLIPGPGGIDRVHDADLDRRFAVAFLGERINGSGTILQSVSA